MNIEEDLFEAASALPDAERTAFLDNACSGKPELRRRLAALLRSHDTTGFMDTQLAVLAASKALSGQSGERIGRYRLLQQIGEGGFGVVWMAEQVEPVTRRVALKIIKAGMDTKEVIARFEAERQALAMMDHPNIAKVLDAGATEKGRPYFVMELVKGIPITRFCDEQGFSTRKRLELFADVCSAINHAHQKGVIHRDLKPSNVMVTFNGNRPVVKVIDFGIAKATQGRLTERTLFTRFEQFVGTPAYMSPEQATISELDIDTRSDIYGLGILLYELLTGKPPFDAKSLLASGYDEMRRIIREVEPPRPSSRLGSITGDERTALAKARQTGADKLVRTVEPDLDWIVMKAIEKDRSRRYETADSLALDVQRYLADEAVSAGPPSVIYRARKFVRRNKAALRVAALITAVVVTAAVLSASPASFALTFGMITAALVLATVLSTWQALRAARAEKRAADTAAREKVAREDAEAVSKFLVEILESPDPSRDGRAVTVAEMLDLAAKNLDTDFAGRPERRKLLQGVLGRTYNALGLYDGAVRQAETTMDYYLEKNGKESEATLSAMSDLGNAYHAVDRLSEALSLREEVLQLRRRMDGPEHASTMQSLAQVAESWEYAGRNDEALHARENVLAVRRKTNGEDNAETLWAMHCVAISYLDCGRVKEALELEQKVLPLARRVFGADHPRTFSVMHILAHCLAECRVWHEAARMWQQEYDGRRQINGPMHPDTLESMTDLATAMYSTGRVDEALTMLERAVTGYRETLGADHLTTVTRTAHLAYTRLSAGRMTEAKSSLMEIAAPRDCDIFTLDGPVHFIEVSALCVWFDMTEEFAANCRRALELAEETRDPAIAERAAKTFCLRPSFDADLLETAVCLAHRAVELGSRHANLPWFRLAAGMAEYRQGDYAAADATLATAEQGAIRLSDSARVIVEQTAGLFRAMSLFRQNRIAAARQVFAVVEDQIPPLPAEGHPLKDVAFHDNLICWLAYREARTLVPPSP